MLKIHDSFIMEQELNITFPANLNLDGTSSCDMAIPASKYFLDIRDFFQDGLHTAGQNLEDIFRDSATKPLSSRSVRTLEDLSEEEAKKVFVNVPKGLKVYYYQYAAFQLKSIAKLADYEQRVLDPLMALLSDIVKGSDLRAVRTFSTSIRFFDAMSHSKTLSSFMRGGIIAEATQEVPMDNAFMARSDIADLAAIFTEAAVALRKFNIDSILKKEKILAKMVDDFITRYEKERDRNETNVTPDLVRELGTLLSSAADEQALIALERWNMLRIETNLVTLDNAGK